MSLPASPPLLHHLSPFLPGDYLGKKGGRAGFEGKLVEKGKVLKGFWYDYDAGITPGNRYECTCVISLDSSGSILKGACKSKGGGSEQPWEAKRWSETMVPREDKKICSFVIKEPAVFARVTDNGKAKREAWTEGARTAALAASVPRHNFDGAMEYVPSSAIGCEYMTQHDLERFHKAEEAAKDAARVARYEAEVQALTEQLAKGDETVKDKLAQKAKLLKGEKGSLALRERGTFKPGLGKFESASSKHAEYLPSPYMTELEVARAAAKEEAGKPVKEKERLLEQQSALTAQLEAGTGDAAELKKQLAGLKKQLAVVEGVLKLAATKFKPTSAEVQLASR